MSAYGTWLMLDDNDERGAPIAYQGSHVIPDPGADRREGWLEVGAIPNHVLAYRNGEEATIESDDETLAAYKMEAIRLGLGNGHDTEVTVVLDTAQVRALRDVLTAWLEQEVTW